MSEDIESPVSNSRKGPVEELAVLHSHASNSTVNCSPKSFPINEFNRSTSGPIYEQPEFLGLPTKERIMIIKEYYNQILPRRSVFKYLSTKGVKFNGDLFVDWKPDDKNKEDPKVSGDAEQKKMLDISENDCPGSPSLLRSRRHVKRQVSEFLDSGEEDNPSPPKITKTINLDSSDEEIFLLPSRKVISWPPTSLNPNDRMNEMFDALKQEMNHDKIITYKSTLRKVTDYFGCSESEQEEEFYEKFSVDKEQSSPPATSTFPSKLTKPSPTLSNPSVPKRRISLRTRTGNSKYTPITKVDYFGRSESEQEEEFNRKLAFVAAIDKEQSSPSATSSFPSNLPKPVPELSNPSLPKRRISLRTRTGNSIYTPIAKAESEQEEEFNRKIAFLAAIDEKQHSPSVNSTFPLKPKKISPKLSKPSVLKRRYPLRTRTGISKYTAIAKTVSFSSEQVDISDKFCDLNNNETNKSEELISCPICFQLFPKTKIVDHAATCDQFEVLRTTGNVNLCNNLIPELVEIDVHQDFCGRQLIKQNENKLKSNNRRKTNTTGFLCGICGRYFVNGNEFEHASKCISVMKDGKKLS